MIGRAILFTLGLVTAPSDAHAHALLHDLSRKAPEGGIGKSVQFAQGRFDLPSESYDPRQDRGGPFHKVDPRQNFRNYLQQPRPGSAPCEFMPNDPVQLRHLTHEAYEYLTMLLRTGRDPNSWDVRTAAHRYECHSRKLEYLRSIGRSQR